MCELIFSKKNIREAVKWKAPLVSVLRKILVFAKTHTDVACLSPSRFKKITCKNNLGSLKLGAVPSAQKYLWHFSLCNQNISWFIRKCTWLLIPPHDSC